MDHLVVLSDQYYNSSCVLCINFYPMKYDKPTGKKINIQMIFKFLCCRVEVSIIYFVQGAVQIYTKIISQVM